jgi:CheY-like chemotaxis protein
VTASSAGPGRGSTFVVELPEVEPPAPAAEAAPAPATTGAGRRVLIVEDNRDTREVLRFSLELAGHEVHDATDGPSGLEALLKLTPDVALVDVGLPGFDGFELVRRARQAGTAARLVALTGYGLPDDLRRSREVGFDTHLVKPVDAARLAAIIVASPRQERRGRGPASGDGAQDPPSR